MADLQHTMVYASSAPLNDNKADKAARAPAPASAAAAAAAAAAAGQRSLADSPEKPLEENDSTPTLQYVVCEITYGGKTSVTNKLEQLEKDCLFLTSRAQSTVRNVSELRVLDAVAIAVVASPSLSPQKVFNKVAHNKAMFPMLRALHSAGRLVCVCDTRTISARIDELERILSINAEDHQRVIEELCREQRGANEKQQRVIEELRRKQQRANEEQQRVIEKQQRVIEELRREQQRANEELRQKFDESSKMLLEAIANMLTPNIAPLPATPKDDFK